MSDTILSQALIISENVNVVLFLTLSVTPAKLPKVEMVLFASIFHTPLFLPAALLDLPVQPSATEVLGFGQTSNASPSALPFRFYEQSRRAPNDPTANRPVFASVDKVPGKYSLNKLLKGLCWFREMFSFFFFFVFEIADNESFRAVVQIS